MRNRSTLFRTAMARATAVLLLAALLAGCGTAGLEKRRAGYARFYEGEPEAALVMLAEAENSKDRLLFALDRGMIAHILGRVDESNEAFAEAERILEETAVTDVTDMAASFLVNDYQLEYDGEDFEAVLIHPFKALNYLALDRPDEALVECRALNNRLVTIEEELGHKNVYNTDGFARYLSGIIYESQGNRNDALVDYRLAAEAFEIHGEAYGTPFPGSLRAALLRLAEAQKLDHLVDEYSERWPGVTWIPYSERKKKGELVVVFENGPAPVKEEARFDIPVDDEIFSLAFPVYRRLPAEAEYAVFRAGGRSVRTELAEDISAIAVKDLEDRYHRVVAKVAARMLIKHAEVEKVQEKNWLLGTVLNIVNTVNERADLRSWETLPANLQIGRLVLPPGYYENVWLDLFRPGGVLIDSIDLGPWEVDAGRTRFLYYRSLG